MYMPTEARRMRVMMLTSPRRSKATSSACSISVGAVLPTRPESSAVNERPREGVPPAAAVPAAAPLTAAVPAAAPAALLPR